MNAPFMLGDCLEALARLPDACIDSIVTDPPYGLNFMGKAWDHGVPGVEFWQDLEGFDAFGLEQDATSYATCCARWAARESLR